MIAEATAERRRRDARNLASTMPPCNWPSPTASIFVPGYGLATAQAQHAVRELAELLEARGVTVKYAIHPVAGRMPGHMNVLLAEANVPYSSLYEMEQINPEFPSTDVAVVIGANDVVNPDARDNPKSLIAGMPILEVDRAKSVIVLKRGQGRGFSGLENPLSSSPAPRCSTATPSPASATWPRPCSTFKHRDQGIAKKWAARFSLAAALSLGCLEMLQFCLSGSTARAWSLPAALCWPALMRRCPSGSGSRTSTCSTWPKHSPWPGSRSCADTTFSCCVSSPG